MRDFRSVWWWGKKGGGGLLVSGWLVGWWEGDDDGMDGFRGGRGRRGSERLTMLNFRNSISAMVSWDLFLGVREVLLSFGFGLLVNWRGAPLLSLGLLICGRVAVLSWGLLVGGRRALSL